VPAAAEIERRELMRQAACMAGAWLACGALPNPALGAVRAHPRSLLVDARGDALAASRLQTGQVHLFNYPYTVSPVFLLVLDRAAEPAELITEDKRRYAAPGGVGPNRSIVAFSAICAHKLMYPTPELSFIGLRKGGRGEPAQVIHCCGDDSRYDPQRGARVLAGPAPQPLAAVLLEWDAVGDRLHAVGTRGGELFDAFFDKYAMKLELENGSGQRQPSGDRAIVRPAASFSMNWRSCPA
jgi:Rieske Fe-S protein